MNACPACNRPEHRRCIHRGPGCLARALVNLGVPVVLACGIVLVLDEAAA